TCSGTHGAVHSFPTRRSSDLPAEQINQVHRPISSLWRGHYSEPRHRHTGAVAAISCLRDRVILRMPRNVSMSSSSSLTNSCMSRSEEHTSELQSRENLVCRLL